MHSGYGGGGGGVSEFQQFMMDGYAAGGGGDRSPAASPAGAAALPFRYHPLHSPAAHFAVAPAPAMHAHYTQQLLDHGGAAGAGGGQQFQLFHHHELFRAPPPHATHHRQLAVHGSAFLPPAPAPAAGFKLGVDGAGEDADGRLRRWRGEDESSMKEPTWRPLDIDYNINSGSGGGSGNSSSAKSGGKNKAPETAPPPAAAQKFLKEDNNVVATDIAVGSNYKLFSELEAIYQPGSSAAGSGSGLTGDDNVGLIAAAAAAELDAQQQQPSDMSAGEEPPAAPEPPAARKRKRKHHRRQEQLSAFGSFFEKLLRQLMEHQDALHRAFLDAAERRDRDRAAREDAWRAEEAARAAQEAAARAADRAAAAARESAIVTFLEKLTGEKVAVPVDPSSSSSPAGRWPKAEVQALIRVRAGLEARFLEPGLKGPLWEEVSAAMAAAGYAGRSAKRCKEKWENINKYFRKARESGKKRAASGKTCIYFDELDQLYSPKAPAALPAPPPSELLDAVVKPQDGDEEEDDGGEEEEWKDEEEEEDEEGGGTPAPPLLTQS